MTRCKTSEVTNHARIALYLCSYCSTHRVSSVVWWWFAKARGCACPESGSKFSFSPSPHDGDKISDHGTAPRKGQNRLGWTAAGPNQKESELAVASASRLHRSMARWLFRLLLEKKSGVLMNVRLKSRNSHNKRHGTACAHASDAWYTTFPLWVGCRSTLALELRTKWLQLNTIHAPHHSTIHCRLRSQFNSLWIKESHVEF
ncbi:hypothetical protein BCV70DRAFT_12932 [Testicularia cyperi]|uniref:Uncharacterized protein n=1 Tax=Testicularia cyperi TaxID=1882483 RepID=A0A317XXZ5_9BASI|nr:hypothetical protein BCV70DRAFT_12932 [Testicularia cyperi]